MYIRKNLLFVFTIVALYSVNICCAQITMPKIFGDKMVLQRGINIPVWGSASPGITVIAKLGKESVTTVADKKGKWMIRFPKFKAGGPYLLTVAEAGKPATAITFKDVLIGDVWLASGQSNMEWEVQQAQDAKNEIAKADYPQIRFIVVSHNKTLTAQDDILAANWKVCDTTNVAKFSAVAYYFSRKIHADQHVPVGIIQSTWGGTPVESWTSREQLLTSPVSKATILNNDTLTEKAFIKDSLDQIRFWDIVYNPQLNIDQLLTATDYDDTEWPAIEMPKTINDFAIGPYEGIMWMRKKITLPASFSGKEIALHIGHPEMNYSLYFNGKEICKAVWNNASPHSYRIPANLVTGGEYVISLRIAMLWGGGGINPPADDMYITDGTSKISLAGKWLYQKDKEPSMPKLHYYQQYPTVLFNAMIHPLIPYAIKGAIWYQGENNAAAAYDYRQLFPLLIKDWRQRWKQGDFPFLYVQLANYMKKQPTPSESNWAELREAQTKTLALPNTAMACIIDIGDAENIHPANKQEVGRRLALNANRLVYKQHVIASGPAFKDFKIEGNLIRIRFENVGAGLNTSDHENITGFAIAGADKKFYWANASIEKNMIIVHSDKVPKPKAVRYAWADNPACNLINSEGLPAIPFRTDDWKSNTPKK
jgi:sialate O-acetylesterase